MSGQEGARLRSRTLPRPRSRHRPAMAAVLVAVVALVPLVSLGPAEGFPVSSASGSWAPTAPPALKVVDTVRLTDGRVLAAENGPGCDGRDRTSADAVCFEVYHPAAGVWSPAGVLTGGPFLEALVRLRNGGALVKLAKNGPNNPPPPQGALWYRYDGVKWEALTFDAVAPPPIAHHYYRGFTATSLDCEAFAYDPVRHAGYPCGGVLVVGGVARGSVKTLSYLYNDEDRTWTQTASLADIGRPGHFLGTAALLDDGRVLVVGNGADIYDPVLNEWQPVDQSPRGGFGWSVRLRDGRVVFGGPWGEYTYVFDASGKTVVPGSTTGQWTQLLPCDSRPHAWQGCDDAALLPDGRLLTAGVYNDGTGSQPLASSFDPDTLRWEGVDDPGIDVATLTSLEGTPDQCGTNCGTVLAAGGWVREEGAPVGGQITVAARGEAEIFQLLKITGVAPDSGLTCGGREVTISGSGFKRATAVNFGAVSVPVTPRNVSADGTRITVRAPRNAPGTVPVTVSQGTTTAVKPDLTFTYAAPDPATVASLTPAAGRADGGEAVAIAGAFPTECVREVRFGDTVVEHAFDAAAPGGRITVTSPQGLPGQQVRVSVNYDPGLPAPEGAWVPSTPASVGADLFTYLALPAVHAVTPARGPAFGGTQVRIVGVGLEGADQLRFGDVAVAADQFSVNSDGTAISATVPADAPGAVPITVSTPRRGASVESGAPQFTYHPGISGVFPPSGPVEGGTEVTIAGKGLAGVSAVRFGAASAAVMGMPADDRIVVTAPAHALAEAVRVQVVASGLTSLPEDVLYTYSPGGNLGCVTNCGGDSSEPPPGDKKDPPGADPAPPGGTGSPAPGTDLSAVTAPSPDPSAAPGAGVSSPAPASSPTAAAVPAPSSSPPPSPVPTPTPSPLPGASPTPGVSAAPGSTPSPVSSGGPGGSPTSGPNPAGVVVPPGAIAPSAAPGMATSGSQGAVGESDDEQARRATRHAMSDAAATLALGGAAATSCFAFLAIARRAPVGRRRGAGRPAPRTAY